MKTCSVLLLLLAASAVNAYTFHETFSSGWDSKWIYSGDEKYTGKFEITKPVNGLDDEALTVAEKAQHYGISAVLEEPVSPAKEPLVLQFDVKLAEGLTCGGAYLKFVSADKTFTPQGLKDNTPYSVMFGPDKCGSTNKVHLIVRHKNTKTGEIEEKHLEAPPSVQDDTKTHTYTAILDPESNTFKILIDGAEETGGSLFDHFKPSFIPAKEIPDPNDKKPSTWVDEAQIVDPKAKKPADWDEDAPMMIPDEEAVKPEGWLDDEPLEIDDPAAEKPDSWDDDEDGEWEPPRIPNPACTDAPGCGEWQRPEKPNPEYKGKWSAPMIDNPAYKGEWKPRDIPNPAYVDDQAPLSNVEAVGGVAIEIWTMDQGYSFDNVVVSNSIEEAESIRVATWTPKNEIEAQAEAEEKKKAELEALKNKEESKSGGGLIGQFSDKVADTVGAVFDSKVLAPYADKLQPVRDLLEGSPILAVAIVSGIVAALLMPLLSRGKKAAADVGEAKKKDVTGADDKASPSKKAANGKKQKQEEIEEEEEEPEADDDEPSPGKAVRRRARRD